jgi:hypothetical protein
MKKKIEKFRFKGTRVRTENCDNLNCNHEKYYTLCSTNDWEPISKDLHDKLLNHIGIKCKEKLCTECAWINMRGYTKALYCRKPFELYSQ